MKNTKLLKTIYYFLSLGCYLVSILFIIKSKSNGMGLMWFLFGCACLGFASFFNKKNNDD